MSDKPLEDKKELDSNASDTPVKPVIDDFAKTMWTSYQQEYLAVLADICYNDEYDTQFNNADVKQIEDLIHAEPDWINAKLMRNKLTHYQKEYIEELKAKMLDATRKLSETRDLDKENDAKMPADYATLNAERKTKESQYYEESLLIMFKLQIGDAKPRAITREDKYRLEWESMKFAIDGMNLSFTKALPKKAKTSRNLYT